MQYIYIYILYIYIFFSVFIIGLMDGWTDGWMDWSRSELLIHMHLHIFICTYIYIYIYILRVQIVSCFQSAVLLTKVSGPCVMRFWIWMCPNRDTRRLTTTTHLPCVHCWLWPMLNIVKNLEIVSSPRKKAIVLICIWIRFSWLTTCKKRLKQAIPWIWGSHGIPVGSGHHRGPPL